jgi:hypothetical protein
MTPAWLSAVALTMIMKRMVLASFHRHDERCSRVSTSAVPASGNH